ncbi:MAG TPA: TonB-dependent receptor [Parvularculaceae bacterium]|nr:TonB-dependent receptor [Parvularculaceae bacterium]
MSDFPEAELPVGKLDCVVQSLAAIAGLLIGAFASSAYAGEQIIVTAERRAQSALDVPASVSVISTAELQRINADHPSEILDRFPGVLIHRGSGVEYLTAIRSPVLTGGAGAGDFLFLQDGVPLRSAGFANVNELFEAQTELASRVEVARGPSGALYGANAIHGVVNVITPAPAENLSGYLDISGDTTARFKGSGLVSNAFGAHRLLAGFTAESGHGYRANSGVDQQKILLRDDWKPGGSWSVSTIISGDNLNQETAGFVVGHNAYKDPVLRKSNPNPEAFRDARSGRIQSEIDYQPNDDLLVSITPFARWTKMSFLMHFVPGEALENNSHWSAGAQTAIYWRVSSRTQIIAGFDWEYTNGDLVEFQAMPTVGSFTQGLHYDYTVGAVSASPFAQATYEVGPHLKAVAAVRLDYARYNYVNHTGDGVVGRFLRPSDRVDQFTTASPKMSLLYERARSTAYVSYARGARPPQTTDLYRLQINQTTEPARPETIDSWEAGWKGVVGDRLVLNLAGYFMRKRHFFFRDADGFNVSNGKTRHVGAEVTLTAELTPALKLDADASYGRHTYRFDRPVLSLPQATEAISSGDAVDTAPRWLAGARALWAPDGLPISAEFEWRFVDRYFMDAANTQIYSGYNLFNLRGAWRLSRQLTATATIRNLLNMFYAERADFAFGEERYFPGEPRELTVGLRATL